MADKEMGAKGANEGDDYDPHKFRNRPAPTSNWETLAHLLKGSLGTGILAMPRAFHHAGIVVGIIATLAVGGMCTYCLHVLVRTQYILCKRHKVPLLSYPESMEKALAVGPNFLRPIAPFSGFVIDFFLVVYQLGICCVYIVFMAESIQHVVEVYEGDVMTLRQYVCCVLPFILLINLIPTLKRLAPFSAIANLLIAAGLGIILYYIFGEGEMTKETLPNYQKFMDFPLFIGTTLFALEAVGVVLALENNMATPKSFGSPLGVLNLGMGLVVFLYLFIGLVGYLRYGSASEDVVVKNLPSGKLKETIEILYVIAILISYALNSFVPVDILWNGYIKQKLKVTECCAIILEYVLRLILVIITFCVAVAAPNVGIFISLFGAFCLSALGISFPALLEACTLWETGLGRFNWILIKDIILFVLGLLALVMGTYTSILEMTKV